MNFWRAPVALLVILCSSNVVFADAPCDQTIATKLNTAKTELTLDIQDIKEVQNACDYIVRRVEYVSSVKALLVELEKQKPCLVDRYGKQKAKIKWALPMTLRAGGKIQLVLNHKKAGSITFKTGQVTFDLETDKKCTSETSGSQD